MWKCGNEVCLIVWFTCPQWVIDFPMWARTFWAAAKCSSLSAPTMKVRVPAAAALTPPETGASTNMAPLALAASDMALLTAGSIVLLSINRAPGWKWGRFVCLCVCQLTKIIKDFLSSPKAWPSILKLKAIDHLYSLQDTTGLSVASDNSVVVWQHGQNAGRFCGNLRKIKAI